MAVSNFGGGLKANEIFSSIYNMIISQQVFADNIKGVVGSLAERFRTDGSLYGDTKLFYATDVLTTHDWGKDAEASSLLALDRPKHIECQAVTIDQFRQIRLTVDNYLSKRAWGTEGAFATFNSVMLGWIGETKKIYDATLVNSYVGTVVAGDSDTGFGAGQNKTINVTSLLGTGSTAIRGEEAARLEGMAIAEGIANIFVELKDISRDFNDYGFLRSYDPNDFVVVWNSKYANKIKKLDLPTIFHKDGLVDKFEEEVLPSRYFGTVNTSDTAGNGTTIRSLVQAGTDEAPIFPGDIVPTSTKLGSGNTYTEASDIICKIIHKDAIKFMSAFEVATEFFNPRSLTENHYLTFGYSKPTYLYNYPVITVKKA